MPAKTRYRWNALDCEWYAADSAEPSADVELAEGLEVVWREPGTTGWSGSWSVTYWDTNSVHGGGLRLRIFADAFNGDDDAFPASWVRPADWRELNEAAEIQLEADKAQQDCCASQCATCVGDWR